MKNEDKKEAPLFINLIYFFAFAIQTLLSVNFYFDAIRSRGDAFGVFPLFLICFPVSIIILFFYIVLLFHLHKQKQKIYKVTKIYIWTAILLPLILFILALI